jgi:hypothetical protein
MIDIRPLGIAESRTFDCDSRIALPCLLTNFRTNMFPFAITISPDEKYLSITGLLLNVVGNWFALLLSLVKISDIALFLRLTGSILMIVSASKS